MNNKKIAWIVRAVCLLLAVLMILGFVITLLPVGTPAAAQSYPAGQSVAVGIAYGASAPASYTVSAPDGFSLGYIYDNELHSLTEFYDSALTVRPCGSAEYYIEFPIDEQVADFEVQYADFCEVADALGMSALPAFVETALCVRFGPYESAAQATAAADAVCADYTVDFHICEPTETALTVCSQGRAVFCYDSVALPLGIAAREPAHGSCYLTAQDGNAYAGLLRFTRYGSGVCVVNVLPLEEYVAGVLPYEISADWNIETQKAFAVCVRSYTLANLGKHKGFGFDLCATTDCQVYRGVGAVNSRVRDAVEQTRHMVLSYNGRPVGAYYSSSTGGCTASAYDVWGGTSFPYLSGNATPWEQYEKYPNGAWSVEVSPTELYEGLKAKGYNGLTGAVAAVEINSYATNSTYVNSISFTDVNGKRITIGKCDKIRIALSSFVKSANFVVARGTQTVGVTDYSFEDGLAERTVTGANVRTMYGDKIVATADGVRTTSGEVSDPSSLRILTSSGIRPFSDAQKSVSCLPDLTVAQVRSSVRTVRAQGKAENFVFIGRGYGHGVGMSQYGAKDLGDMGYSYDMILNSYFPQAQLGNMTVLK